MLMLRRVNPSPQPRLTTQVHNTGFGSEMCLRRQAHRGYQGNQVNQAARQPLGISQGP